MLPGRTSSAAPATRSTRSKAPQAFPPLEGAPKPSLWGEGVSRRLTDEGSFVPRPRRSGAGIISRPGASVSFVSDGPISSNSGRNGGKNAGRNCVSALPQRATPVRCRPRFPSRNRRFPDRCRSPDCASTAFRCRCLLLWQKLFVLPRRRLRNNYTPCPTGTPTFADVRRQRRDLIIATRPAHPILPSHSVSGSGARGTSSPPNRQRLPPHQFREASTAKFALARPAPRDP